MGGSQVPHFPFPRGRQKIKINKCICQFDPANMFCWFNTHTLSGELEPTLDAENLEAGLRVLLVIYWNYPIAESQLFFCTEIVEQQKEELPQGAIQA